MKKNGLIFMGMAAIVLAFGLAAVGCENNTSGSGSGSSGSTYTFVNNSSYRVLITSTEEYGNWSFTVASGATETKTVEGNSAYIQFSWSSNTVDPGTGLLVDNSSKISVLSGTGRTTFTNK